MSKFRRNLSLTLAAALAAITIAALASWPSTPDLRLEVPVIDAAPDGWLAARETLVDAEHGIFAATEKRVRWQVGKAGRQTDIAVVYLHGFSATRQETAPVSQRLADALGANLFETRLAGHGLKSSKLVGVSAEDWLADTAEAVAIGRRIGKRIILIGTSTGATLALAAAAARPEDIAALVLISPNLALRDDSSEAMLWPGGRLLTRLMLGPTHSWEANNAMQARFWTTEYPTAAIVEVMRLVKAVRHSMPLALQQPLLSFISRQDDVINVERTLAGLGEISAPAKKIVEIETQQPGHHVLAGDILAPQKTDPVVQEILAFVASQVDGSVAGGEL